VAKPPKNPAKSEKTKKAAPAKKAKQPVKKATKPATATKKPKPAKKAAQPAKKPTKKPAQPSANGKPKTRMSVAAPPPKKPAKPKKTGRLVGLADPTTLPADAMPGDGGIVPPLPAPLPAPMPAPLPAPMPAPLPAPMPAPMPGDTGGTTAGGATATPRITDPLAGATVAAGTNLQVDVSTNRGDLGYIVELLDITPSTTPMPMPAMPVTNVVAGPAGNNFSTTFTGFNLVAGHQYRIRVSVDPAFRAQVQDHILTVTAQ
jgi:hypothetical protein